MNLLDKVVELMKSETKKRYAYISKKKDNMSKLNVHVSETVDFAKTKVSVFVVNPIGLTGVTGKLDGVFADSSATTEDHLRKFLDFKKDSFLKWVNPETLELEDGTVPNDKPTAEESK